MDTILHFCLFWIITSLVDCSTDDNVTLILGGAPYQGLVQISHGGRTGLVCDDSFTNNAGRVVCRQIGYPTASPKIMIGGSFKNMPSGMDYILDDVACSGGETRLSNCNHSPWFHHDCSPSETVAVFCNDTCVFSKPCQNGGTCNALSETSYHCACPHYWTGHNCELDVDECQQNIHGCSHRCINTINGYHCTCPDVELVLSTDGHSCSAPGETVTCSSQQMEISFTRDRFPGLHEQYMTLRDPTCHATGNSTFISLVSPLSGCGTTSHKVGNNIVYENTVKSHEVIVEGVISRVRDISVPFQCVVPVVNNVDVPLDIDFSTLHFAIDSFGSYDVRLELFHDQHFNKTPEDPFYITPGEAMYVQLTLQSADTTLIPFALTCDATPTKHRYNNIYPIIEQGCAVDDSVKYLPSPTFNVQRFSMEAFKYIDNSPAVYLHCDVIVCSASDNSSRCASGCMMTHPGRRAARDVANAPMSANIRLETRYLNVPKPQIGSSFEHAIFWTGLTAACAAGMLLILAIVYNYRLIFVKRRPTFY